MSHKQLKQRAALFLTFAAFLGVFVLNIQYEMPDPVVRVGNLAYGYASSGMYHPVEPDPPPAASSTPAASSASSAPASSSSSVSSKKSSSAASSTSSIKLVPSLCGNGVIDTGEECDSGSGLNGSGLCSKYCTINVCGDAIIAPQMGEECEPEGVEVEVRDPVTGAMKKEVKYEVVACGRYCDAPVCAKDAKGVEKCSGGCTWQFGEACNGEIELLPPNFFSFRKFSSAKSSPRASPPLQLGISSAEPTCGNGRLDVRETCDQGPMNSNVTPNSCRTNCTYPACGDGVVDSLFGEICDDGPGNSQDQPGACRLSCTRATCGDSVVDAGEDCDGTDDCTPQCTWTADALTRNACGNQWLDAGELCDDGNRIDGDGCSATCTIEGAPCADCEIPACGDAVLQGEEECDDGNADDTDACTTACQLPECGNGIVQNGETCDDGNRTAGDGCTTLCTLEAEELHSAAPKNMTIIITTIAITSALSTMLILLLKLR